MHWLLLFLLSFLPAHAAAGAWLREEGTGFAASSVYATAPFGAETSYTGLYLEYGLTPNLTFGLDIGRGVTGKNKTVGFVRLPVLGTGGHRVAAELGFGQIAGERTLRPGLSYGRGLETRLGGGWLAVDAYAEYSLDSRALDLKADATLGVSRPSGQKWMLQLQAGQAREEASFLRLVPSMTFELRKGWQLELGLSKALTGARENGVKFGMWHDF